MKLILKKQPQKYLKAVDAAKRKKLNKGLDDILEFRGNIERIQGHTKNYYRYKIDHYRILFTVDTTIEIIFVEEINTRTNIKYR